MIQQELHSMKNTLTTLQEINVGHNRKYLYKKLLDLYKWFIKFDDAVAKHLDNICDEVRRQKEIVDKINQG